MPKEKELPEGWLTPEEVADELAVGYITVIRWLNNKELRGYRIGQRWRVKREDLDAWLSRKANTGEMFLSVAA